MPTLHTLDQHLTLCLTPTAPFHFDGTVHKPSYFPTSNLAFEPGFYWQSLCFEGQVFGVRLTNAGDIDRPGVELTLFAQVVPDEAQAQRIAAELAYRFAFGADITSFTRDVSQDQLLRPALERWRGMRPSVDASLYEFLAIATVLQNATVRRSVQMMETMFQNYGSRAAFDGRELSVFWPARAVERASEEELRALKLGYRAKTFKRQAAAFSRGEIDELALRAMPTAELKKTLLSIYGVGPASVWYMLFQVFHRYDTFEHISPWEQKIFSNLLFDTELTPVPEILAEVDRRWGRWKMLAAHYLFEDLFWQRKTQNIPWLEALIRL